MLKKNYISIKILTKNKKRWWFQKSYSNLIKISVSSPDSLKKTLKSSCKIQVKIAKIKNKEYSFGENNGKKFQKKNLQSKNLDAARNFRYGYYLE